MQISTVGKRRSNNPAGQQGFSYAVVLVAIVLIGIFAGVANVMTSRIVQVDREAELMFRGMAYRSAIQRYYAVAKRYPRSVDELLKDSRFASRPYLRERYPDPMVAKEGKTNADGGWRLLRGADGGIAGVASRSRQEPIKKANFPSGFEKFDGANSYTEWLFVYDPHPIVATKLAISALK